jgi:hypothetical protein
MNKVILYVLKKDLFSPKKNCALTVVLHKQEISIAILLRSYNNMLSLILTPRERFDKVSFVDRNRKEIHFTCSGVPFTDRLKHG